MIPYPPDEDSPGLSLEEVSQAIVAPDVATMIAGLEGKTCRECSSRFSGAEHKLLRRVPHYYSKATLICPSGHREAVLFRIDWLTRD